MIFFFRSRALGAEGGGGGGGVLTGSLQYVQQYLYQTFSVYSVAMRDEVAVLAQTIWGEARGEGNEGMEAVASVIVNRADYPPKGTLWWGHTIEEVCKKPYAYQFECWNQGNQNRVQMESVTEKDPQFRMACMQ